MAIYSVTRKRKQKKINSTGIVHIKTTFNNTLITVSDLTGNTICWSSAGAAGFKNARKATAFAAQMVAKAVTAKCIDLGLKKIDIILKGRGKGRESSVRTFKQAGLRITSIEDKTKVPFNGCRPPKKRRL